MIDPHLTTSNLLPFSLQSRCRGCGYRKRHRPGPIRLLVGFVICKIQEKEKREMIAANLRDGRVVEMQEHGVGGTVDEKEMEDGEEKDEDVKVFTESVRSLSL